MKRGGGRSIDPDQAIEKILQLAVRGKDNSLFRVSDHIQAGMLLEFEAPPWHPDSTRCARR
jgi:hypothetical protein